MVTINYLVSLFNFTETYGTTDDKTFAKNFAKKFLEKFYDLNFESYITNYLYNKIYVNEINDIKNMVKALWLCTLIRFDIKLTKLNANAYKIYWVRIIKNIMSLDVNLLTNTELFYHGMKLLLALTRFASTVNYIEKNKNHSTETYSGMKDVLETETMLEISETILDSYSQEIKLANNLTTQELLRKISTIQKV